MIKNEGEIFLIDIVNLIMNYYLPYNISLLSYVLNVKSPEEDPVLGLKHVV
jgi:hypothetical protein